MIDELGFLSPDIQDWIGKHRAEHKGWFELAGGLNSLVQLLILDLRVPENDSQRLVGALLLMRAASAFQGALLLSERGMTSEARSLVREIFETVFWLGATASDAAFADSMVHDDIHQRRKLARALLSVPADKSGLEQKQVEGLRRFLDQSDSGEALQIEATARKAGLKEIYDTYYRGLSNDSSHPSLTALKRHVEQNGGQVVGLNWGPNASDVGDTINQACTAAVYVVKLASDLFGGEKIGNDFERCWAMYKHLIDTDIAAKRDEK